MKNDALGDRMKRSYEIPAQTYLPRKTFTVVRIDGRAFHTYTRKLKRPYDEGFANDLDTAAVALCADAHGAQLAYVQSDEISLIMHDLSTDDTQPWFGGKVQKITSVASSIVTAEFNAQRCIRARLSSSLEGFEPQALAYFDARVFTIPVVGEVANYLIWRQNDALRNAVSMIAHTYFSNKELHGKKTAHMVYMLGERGIFVNNFPVEFLNGRIIRRMPSEAESVEYVNKRTGERHVAEGVVRHTWTVEPAPLFVPMRDTLFEWIMNPPDGGEKSLDTSIASVVS